MPVARVETPSPGQTWVCVSQVRSVGDRAVGRISGAFGRPGTARPVGQPAPGYSAGNYTSCDLLFGFPMADLVPKVVRSSRYCRPVSRSTKGRLFCLRNRTKSGSIVSGPFVVLGADAVTNIRLAVCFQNDRGIQRIQRSITGWNVPPHQQLLLSSVR